MHPTKYHKPSSVEDAVAALGAGGDAKILAGGQTLLPTMKQHLAAPSDLVDVRAISGMSGVTVGDGSVTIGAATTHAEVAASPEVRQHIPGLAALAGGIGDPAVRHMGTLGGSVANNDPAADYPAAVLGLGATILTSQREISADDFFEGMFTTALEEDEIITAIRFPVPAASAYAKFDNPASRYAMTGVFVARTASGIRVAVTGAGDDGVMRHDGLEAALNSSFTPEACANVAIDSDGLLSDIHASAAYRANLIRQMTKRAVVSAT